MPTPKEAKFSGPLEQVTVLCTSCEHRNDDGITCKAFPKGIPTGVFTGDLDHTKAIPGDKGVLYSKKKLSNAEVLKANPYHDELGKFSTHDGAKFVSIGPVFDTQRYNSPASRAARQWASDFGQPAPRLFKPVAPVAAKPVTSLAELASAPKVHSVEDIAKDIDELKKAGVDVVGVPINWHDAFKGKVLPREIMNAMLGGLPKNNKPDRVASLKMEVSPTSYDDDANRKYEVTFRAKNVDVHGAFAPLVSRRINTERKEVDHSYLELEKSDRGGPAVKKMFAEAIPLYQKMGLEKVTVHANLDAGGYAWGRYGFSADTPSKYYSAVKTRLDDHGLAGLANIAGYGPEHKKEYEALHSLADKYKNNKELPSIFTTAQTPHLDALYKKYYPLRNLGYKQIALGSMDWQGHLILKDKARLQHLGAYVGKKLD